MIWNEYPQMVKEALFTSLLSVTLVILLIVIRHLKQEPDKYPYYIVFSPLMIVATYPFLTETYELIVFINIVVKMSSIVVLLILLITEKSNIKHYHLSLAGIYSIMAGMVIHWIVDIHIALNTLWPFLLASGMIMVTFTFPSLLRTLSNIKTVSTSQ